MLSGLSLSHEGKSQQSLRAPKLHTMDSTADVVDATALEAYACQTTLTAHHRIDGRFVHTRTDSRRTGCTLYCFSPPVMVATAVLELALAAYTIWRYRKGRFGKVATSLLVLLAVFQIAEYEVCTGQNSFFWSRVGLIATALMPAGGLYLVSLVSRKKHFLRLGYAAAAVCVLMFALAPKTIVNSFCGGNYVIFTGPEAMFRFYGAYYFGFLVLGIWEAVEALNASIGERTRPLLRWMIIGYLSFMLPTSVVYATYEPARVAVASIMCGFAVVLALILTFQIVPRFYRYSPSSASR